MQPITLLLPLLLIAICGSSNTFHCYQSEMRDGQPTGSVALKPCNGSDNWCLVARMGSRTAYICPNDAFPAMHAGCHQHAAAEWWTYTDPDSGSTMRTMCCTGDACNSDDDNGRKRDTSTAAAHSAAKISFILVVVAIYVVF